MSCILTPSSSSVWGGRLILKVSKECHWRKARARSRTRVDAHTRTYPQSRPSQALLLGVVFQVGVQVRQAPGGHLLEQRGELVLPLVAVLHQRELEV